MRWRREKKFARPGAWRIKRWFALWPVCIKDTGEVKEWVWLEWLYFAEVVTCRNIFGGSDIGQTTYCLTPDEAIEHLRLLRDAKNRDLEMGRIVYDYGIAFVELPERKEAANADPS